MSTIRANDFPGFLKGLHGYEPFPWQTRLCAYVLEHGQWPAILNLPTGVGKTSAIDIALFALACDPRRFARRIVLVVDRRIIVDQAAKHAGEIIEAMKTSESPIVLKVAAALRACWQAGPSDDPFEVAVLRGGMPRDNAWARQPDLPVVALSTVDQVGSRLFFRGYGVSKRMRPVHAGLLGMDTLFLLDEVHLSVPFSESLSAVTKHYRHGQDTEPGTGRVGPDRWSFVQMSATPGEQAREEDQVFELGGKDESHPVLAQRLNASKPATLVEVGSETALANGMLKAIQLQLKSHAGRDRPLVIAAVCNRVQRARELAAKLAAIKGAPDVVLLTGRMRPLDRDALLSDKLRQRLENRSKRSPEDPPFVLVATQCIEAGADFDFDAMVTECASLDALKQRFGRLNRRGELDQAPVTIITNKPNAKKADPVYGQALANTWRWLQERAENLDVGIRKFPSDSGADLLAPVEHAPILLPGYLDAWTQTRLPIQADPDVSLWLHGPQRRPDDVQVVWREWLPVPHANNEETAQALLAACATSSLEAMPVPLYAVRSWLENSAETLVADVPADAGDEATFQEGRPVFRWLGKEAACIFPRAIRAGDTIVVPASYGGISQEVRDAESGRGLLGCTWDPGCTEAVSDLSEQAHAKGRGRALVHIPVPRFEPEEQDALSLSKAWIESELKDPGWPGSDEWLHALRKPKGLQSMFLDGYGFIAWATGRLRNRDHRDVPMDEASSSFTEEKVTLVRHTKDVTAWVDRFAKNLDLPKAIRSDLCLAARFHDWGKADPRFQRMLLGGSEVRLAIQAEPLAKSSHGHRDFRARAEADARSGYPVGTRHELMSLALLEAHPELLKTAHDQDLVKHLVASHHGWCRPFPPPILDPEPVAVKMTENGVSYTACSDHQLARIGAGVADRFSRLGRQYGPWPLAWLETILQLADHKASAEGGPS